MNNNQKERIICQLFDFYRNIPDNPFGIVDYFVFEKVIEKYFEPHRFYHDIYHVEYLFYLINKNCTMMSNREKALLATCALYHDVVYFPQQKDNEFQSAKWFERNFKYKNRSEQDFQIVKSMILNTEHGIDLSIDENDHEIIKLSATFNAFDYHKLLHTTDMQDEIQLFKEYQYLNIKEYLENREKFLLLQVSQPSNPSSISNRLGFIRGFKPNIGIFAGTFNKFHAGHLNILEKAERIFDKVIVLCAVNPAKDTKLQDVVIQVKDVLPFHEIVGWKGFLTEYAKQVENQGARVTLVKGVRDDHDLNSELNQYKFMQDMDKEISVVYIPCDREFEHISSSSLKMLNSFSRNMDVKYLPTKYAYYKGM